MDTWCKPFTHRSTPPTQHNTATRQAALRVITDDDQEARRLWVQAACPSQLVAAHLFLGDHARALSAVDRAYRLLLRRWGGVHPSAAAARQAQLRGLQFLVEAEEALLALRQAAGVHGDRHAAAAALPLLLERWAGPSRRAPCRALDPPAVWSEVGALREWCLAGGQAQQGQQQQPAGGRRGGVQAEAARHRHGLQFWCAAAAASLRHRETEPATSCWRRAHGHYGALAALDEQQGGGGVVCPTPLIVEQLRLFAARDRILLERGLGAGAAAAGGGDAEALVRPVWGSLAAKVLVSAVAQLDTLPPSAQRAVLQEKARWMELAYEVATTGAGARGEGGGPSGEEMVRALGAQFLRRWKTTEGSDPECFGADEGALRRLVGDPAALRRAWLRCAHASHVAGLRLLEGATEAEEAARASGRFAVFCDTALRRHQERRRGAEGEESGSDLEGEGPLSAPALAAQAVEHYLRALACSPREAPGAGVMRVVDLVRSASPGAATAEAARRALAEGAGRVPSWCFLSATNQLLAGVDAAEAESVLPLLERLAADYPQALFFPYRVRGWGREGGCSGGSSMTQVRY